MTKYNIIKWDAVLASNGLNPVPVIFIKPDLEFIKLIRNNNYFVNVDISNSRSIYDGKPITGYVSRSSFIDDESRTYLYYITLDSMWYGYPPVFSPGQAEFY